MLRKLYFVIDCDNDEQKESVQEVLNEISNTRAFTGRDIVGMKPAFEKNKGTLTEIFRMIQQGGVSSLFSIKGGMLLKRLKQ